MHAGHRVRYFTAAELVETLYRGLADNSVGRVIDTQLRHDLICAAPAGSAHASSTPKPQKGLLTNFNDQLRTHMTARYAYQLPSSQFQSQRKV